jgi:hypothetical protein
MLAVSASAAAEAAAAADAAEESTAAICLFADAATSGEPSLPPQAPSMASVASTK